MDEEQIATAILNRILGGNMSPLAADELPKDTDSPLIFAVKNLALQIVEAYNFVAELSSGNLSCKAPRHNMLLGSSKELQSVMRHLLWTVECVANGDYQQSVEFLGDFSKYFNLFTKQVELREKEQAENARLEKHGLEEKCYLLNELVQQQVEYYNSLHTMHQTVRGLKHDMKNHCFALNDLLNMGDVGQAQEYLTQMSSLLLVAQDYIYHTGNPVFDALLTDKISKAKNDGITVHVQLAMGENLDISNMDWCILLGNTLDNAIEACNRLQDEHKQIWIVTQVRRNIFNLSIKNTALKPIQNESGLYATSKKDDVEHGIGLKNVQSVVEKYSGVLQTKFEDGCFAITIMLCDV